VIYERFTAMSANTKNKKKTVKGGDLFSAKPKKQSAAPANAPSGAVAQAVKKLLGPLPSDMSFERKTVYRCLRCGALALVLLSLFMLFRCDLTYISASRAARIGNTDKALIKAETLVKEGYSSSKVDVIRLLSVKSLLEQGDYVSASSLMDEVEGNRDLSAYRAKADYLKAQAEWDSGDYSLAATDFRKLGSYEDSADRYADCICATAIQKLLNGDENAASGLIDDIADAPQRISRIAQTVAGDRAEFVSNHEIFTAEGIQHHREMMNELASALSDSRCPHVATGKWHTVLARENGTVLATGDNSEGQCDVSTWSDVTQVAAGRYHTLALKSDGTVLATGSNAYGQCDVSQWSDIVEIAAGAYISVGLKSDGTVVAAGHNTDAVTGWTGISRISAGGYSVCGIATDSTMLCSHKGALMGVETRLKAANICGAVSVGITTEGNMVCTMDGAPIWNNVVYVCASETAIMAIDTDGKVLCHYFHPSDDMGITLEEAAAEIAVDGDHCVVLTKSGSVYSFGSNEHNQCDTNGWEM